MNSLRTTAAAFACVAALLYPPLSAAAEAARPSFEAHSELFELVGRIKDGRLTLTLDRWASNEPVSGAQIEIELNGRSLVAEAQTDGSYVLDAAPFATPATYPLTITVNAGEDSDLLATDFVVAGETATPANAVTGSTPLGIGIAAALALLAATVALLRRRKGEHA